ncbi:hypothetical protein [Rhizobium hidalgonense]|uniref:hypothetical protein n=1 Tax=Rhizobium hidalgonense TaxID=1538159 RepID=UPI0013E32767|nr:hypothetical protein [Rhizobium hidalgonense]
MKAGAKRCSFSDITNPTAIPALRANLLADCTAAFIVNPCAPRIGWMLDWSLSGLR